MSNLNANLHELTIKVNATYSYISIIIDHIQMQQDQDLTIKIKLYFGNLLT